MSDREELDRLIEAALADNKLTAKEMEVLAKKAKQLGIEEDEFLIELDAKKYKSKLNRRNELISKFLNFFKRLGLTKSIILFIVLFLVIGITQNSIRQSNVERKLSNAIENKDFDVAFKLLIKHKESFGASNEKHITLLNSYIPFLLENNLPGKAVSSMLEYDIAGDIESSGNLIYSRIDIYNRLIISIVSYFVFQNNMDEASKILTYYKKETIPDLSKEQWGDFDEYNQRINQRNVYLVKSMQEGLNRKNINRNQAISFLETNLESTIVFLKKFEGNPNKAYYQFDKSYISKTIQNFKKPNP
jgi:hypothetical protein